MVPVAHVRQGGDRTPAGADRGAQDVLVGHPHPGDDALAAGGRQSEHLPPVAQVGPPAGPGRRPQGRLVDAATASGPHPAQACLQPADPLAPASRTCRRTSTKRWPTVTAVSTASSSSPAAWTYGTPSPPSPVATSTMIRRSERSATPTSQCIPRPSARALA